MTRYILLAFAVSLFSCTSKTLEESTDWILKSTEIIEHQTKGDQRIQILYSTLDTGLLNFYDTSIVIEQFKNTLLLERIHYNIENGDSIKWSHTINEYNTDGLILSEIDSVDGDLRLQSFYFYENGKLQRSEHLTIIPNYNNVMELVGTDTMRFKNHSYYDEEGKCIKVMSLSKDELLAALTGDIKYDTTLTFNQFNERSKQIGSVTLTNGDTIAMSRTIYDESDRKILFVDASLKLGTTTLRYEYDERGNRTSELFISDDYKDLTITKFDELNRPVNRKKYKPKTFTLSEILWYCEGLP